MTPILCLISANREGDPSGPLLLLLYPTFFLAVLLLSNFLLGIYGLYREFPADENDRIDQSLGWVQVEFGLFRGHMPMSLRLGSKALHIKGVFPFQPLFWLGPASVPWERITQTRRIDEGWWRFWSSADFLLGTRRIRLRGKAGRVLQARMDASSGQVPQAIMPR